MRKIVTLTLFISSISVFSQNVVLSESESIADASAIFDVQSENKGMLIPRLSELQRLSINAPAEGLTIYQTDENNGFFFYDGTEWRPLVAGGDSEPISPFPKMSYSTRNNLTDLEEGDMIYQLDNTPGLRVYNSTDWDLIVPRTAYLRHQEDNGINESNSADDDWNTRTLNVIEGYIGFFASSLSGNQFNLEPGIYKIDAQAPGYTTSQHQIALFDSNGDVARNTDNNEMYGASSVASNNDAGFSRSILSGTIKVTDESSFSIRHYTRSPVTAGLGLSYAPNGNPEVYTTVKITKIAD